MRPRVRAAPDAGIRRKSSVRARPFRSFVRLAAASPRGRRPRPRPAPRSRSLASRSNVMRTAFLSTTLLLAAALPAQHLVIYSPAPGPGFVDEAAPSPLFPGPAPPSAVYPTAPLLPPVPPGPPFFLPPGDSSLNSI